MKICYIVYREDNVMVFQSQVLEYLKQLEMDTQVESCEIILFRHQDNLHKRKEVEERIRRYVSEFKTFATIAPPLFSGQLWIDAFRLKRYISSTYKNDDKIGVICRGDFSTYIASFAFRNFKNSRILYDNRGLPLEESLYAHPKGLLHSLNRRIKYKSINYAKGHCDMYNFVTNNMRNYLIDKYNYTKKLPFTVIPTLYKPEILDLKVLESIKAREEYKEGDRIISYVGSSAAWQETDKLIEIIKEIHKHNREVRFFILTNGDISKINSLSKDLRDRITIKNIPHNEMKYYLQISDVGIVIRDNNIINQVAAPTKIAEYITSGLPILYCGEIGIISDVKDCTNERQFISLNDDSWIDSIDTLISEKSRYDVENSTLNYFDMTIRQRDTLTTLESTFNNRKVR